MKDKLEVGMYVRTKNGLIAKFIGYRTDEDIEYSKYLFDGKIYWYYEYYNDYVYDEDFKEWYEEKVIKTSHNIIDLIEVGDYVNGYYVSKIWKSGEITHYVDDKPIQRKERQITIQAPSYGGIIHLHNEDIKSIVTKEQFESMEYKLGDDK